MINSKDNGVYTKMEYPPYSLTQKYAGEVYDMYCGTSHTIIATPDGYFVDGRNDYHQFGCVAPTYSEDYIKLTVLDNYSFQDLYVGDNKNFIKLTNGEYMGWGNNISASLGIKNDLERIETPIALPFIKKLGIKSLHCGYIHTLGLTYCGQLYMWGSFFGSVPDDIAETPTLVKGLKHVIIDKVFTGTHSPAKMVQSIDGRVFLWSYDNRTSLLGVEGNVYHPKENYDLCKAKFKSVTLDYTGTFIVVERDMIDIKNRKHFRDVEIITSC
jgi:alpha-tubulin suppressor-like RCC1 family protein